MLMSRVLGMGSGYVGMGQGRWRPPPGGERFARSHGGLADSTGSVFVLVCGALWCEGIVSVPRLR